MGHKVIKIIPPKERCNFCNKQAEFLCYMPIGTTMSTIDFKKKTITCDKKMCANCATRVGAFDFCPSCVNKIKSTKKGK